MNCIECNKNKIRVKKCGLCSTCYSRKWRNENSDRSSNYQRQYYQEHKEKIIDYALSWQKSNPSQYKKIRSKWSKESNYATNRYHADPNFRLRKILRSRLLQSVKFNEKAGSSVSDLGCSIEEFKEYLESKFSVGMTWDNYGDWHIDHIVPLSSFDLTDRAQFLKACHYTNMQPLWKEDNLKKSDY